MNWFSRLILISILILSGCQGPQSVAFQRRVEDEYYLSSGPVRYFLSELPHWANTSQSAACFRKESARFFDLKALRSSFSLSYEDALQLQLSFNQDLSRLKKINTSGSIPISQEEDLFLQVSEKISSKIKVFQVPTFPRVHLIWIDSIEEERRGALLKKFLNSEKGMNGFPILFSLCQSTAELGDWVSQNLVGQSVKILGYEMLSPYTDESELSTEFSTYWDHFFDEKQAVIFYKSSKFNKPSEVKTKKYTWKDID
ncbi:MAG: hypothetical protein COW00_15575 [Bdellovibrio sp. CG12_big_fil_rev_8_21_14_0_65_39_13]|nr:MAG: hypothetical protein COW78_05440 [Bdellovibrio sp. CG22_combo_CG10-13_8_21_14_all_39_27]PIQ58420.1 MAG: hypothetical protein COW00_15575 [Bdellovibrio sp. CG12_big_fil_rev_8_21_14_0_65_39_13]PIR35373.1 MAG: hypothetical protein COV37_07790 [Bdellovibrio sp. CG11_big_fil_rev_8_21_14_0_20_39_38]PJB52723.1 MAG: hypothetical protein CO099_11095 [Bdellovibrio sp. CG_4_9_14_3_um_filter_39_7]